MGKRIEESDKALAEMKEKMKAIEEKEKKKMEEMENRARLRKAMDRA